MKSYLLAAIFTILVFYSPLMGKKDVVEPNSNLTISLNQDPSFGFYPSLFGTMEIDEGLNFTYYGIFWTQDIMGGKQGGLNLMVEFGAGVEFVLFEEALRINPMIGIGSGNYQSGGGRPVIADNIVPSLSVIFTEGAFSLTAVSTNWIHFREESRTEPYRNLFEYSFSPQIALSKYVSLGLMYDHLIENKKFADTSESQTVYQWIGPSIKFSAKSGASLWIGVGLDFSDYANNAEDKRIKDFYKMTASFTL